MTDDIDERVRLNGLHEVIYDPLPEHLSGIMQIRMVGQHDDGDGRTLCEKLQKRIAFTFGWNLSVAKNHVDRLPFFRSMNGFEALFSSVSLQDLISLLCQRLIDELPHFLVAFNDEHSHCGHIVILVR